VGTYRLTPAAQKDLENIWTHKYKIEGVERALNHIDSLEAACSRLCETPRMCRERTEYRPPVRIFPYRRVLIVYMINEEDIDIIRFLHAGMDVETRLTHK